MKLFHRRGLKDSETIFNYRLSRARRVVENAFGIVSSRFPGFRRPMLVSPECAQSVVLAATSLHNFLRTTDTDGDELLFSVDNEDISTGTITPGTWRDSVSESGLQSLTKHGSRCPSGPKALRDSLANYFLTDGAVPWQWRLLQK